MPTARADLTRRAVATLEAVVLDEGGAAEGAARRAAPSPSMVVMAPALVLDGEARGSRGSVHRRRARCTLRRPPWLQPFFVPVRSRCSRSTSRREVRTSTSMSWMRSLTSSFMVPPEKRALTTSSKRDPRATLREPASHAPRILRPRQAIMACPGGGATKPRVCSGGRAGTVQHSTSMAPASRAEAEPGATHQATPSSRAGRGRKRHA